MDRIGTSFTRGPSFSVAPTIDADAFTLSLWLDEEIVRHNPSVRSDDQRQG